MTWSGTEPTETDFVVFRSDGATRVLKRGDDEPVFDGSSAGALQHAINAGEATGSGTTITMAPGQYELDREVTLAASTWLTGSGAATTLRADAGLDTDLLSIPTGAAHVRISGLRLDGNRSDNEQGDCLVVRGDTWRTVIEHLVIRNGARNGVRFEEGPDGVYSYEPTLADIDVARCAGDGFIFGHTGDLFGVNLYAEACERYGFTMADAGGTLVHPHAYDTRGEAGIRMLESAKDTTLLGAHSERNRRHGVLIEGERITVQNGFFANNSRDAPGSYSGIVLDGARHSRISESTFVNDDDRDRTQDCGIIETGDSHDNRITANLFQNNVSSAIERNSQSNGSVYRQNQGYRTDNGGRATISHGGTIRHGLADQPDRFWVESMEAGTYAHVTDVVRSRLVVEVVEIRTGQPPDSDVDVVWGAVVD